MGNKVFNRKYGLGTEGLFGADGIIPNDPEDISEKKTEQNSRRNKKKDGMGYHQLFL